MTLDRNGIAAAVALGALILVLGGNYGVFFLLDMLLFLAMAAVVTNIGAGRKKGIGVYERSRGWRNVLSNGIAPLGIVLLYFVNSHYGFAQPQSIVLMYVASVAAISADKFASELGVLDGEPVMLVTLRRVKKGVSGAVTLLGLASGAVASLIIGLSLLAVYGSPALILVVVVLAAGVAGNLVDSLFGYWEEKGVGNKYTSNLACAIAGAAVCAALILVF